MSKSETEKLSDMLIGEAVMGLLDADEEITFAAVLQVLTEARMKQENHAREGAYTRAIADVKGVMAEVKRGRPGYEAGAASDDTGRGLDGSLPGSGDRMH